MRAIEITYLQTLHQHVKLWSHLVMPNDVTPEIRDVRVVPEEECPMGVGRLLSVGDHARPALVLLKVDGTFHLGPSDGAVEGAPTELNPGI